MMKFRNCRSTLHHINAIKGGLVIKIENVNSCKKPGLVFKNLKDIYETECARHLRVLSKFKLQDECENGVVSFTIDNSCQPMAERITSESEHKVNISDCSGNTDETVSGLDDLSFGKMTLTQLKKRYKTKKRKMPDFVCLSPKKELTDFQPEEDDCDLTTPLSSWTIKVSKSAKSKKKRARRSASAISKHDISFKTKQILVAKCSQQLSSADCDTKASYDYSSSDEQVNLFDMGSTKLLQTSDAALENKEIISLAGQYETCVNTFSCSQLDDNIVPISFLPPLNGKAVGLSTQETSQHSFVPPVSELHKEAGIMHLSYSQSSQSCSNMQEISGDQDSDMPLDNGICCTDLVHGSELTILEDNATNSTNMLKGPQCCLNMPEILSSKSGCLVSNAETDDSLCCTEIGRGNKLSVFEVMIKSNLPHNLPNGSLRSPSCYYSSPSNCYPCSDSDSDLIDLEHDLPTIEDDWTLISNNSDVAGNCLEPNIHLTDLEGASYANEEKQLLSPVNTDAEGSFSSNAVSQLSTPETNNHHDVVRWQPPERFPSMRKAISPTSQEKLCMAMSSRELCDGIENYKCKDKLFFENQTEGNALSVAADTTGVESFMTGEPTGKVDLTEAILGPKKILKKPKHNKEGSLPKRCSPPKGHFEGLPKKDTPPKGRLEGPHLTRSFPRLCTGRTSTEACHESAIAFSQRQMQDVESIAFKLMTELKSMKDIVEEKLLYEAYRCTSIRNDADEVKSAIKSATKVEETTKKWLSMMARDCNRFCKIMSQPQRSTEDVSPATENITHKEKKRISFADEAGGVLCHVKYFENGENNTKVAS